MKRMASPALVPNKVSVKVCVWMKQVEWRVGGPWFYNENAGAKIREGDVEWNLGGVSACNAEIEPSQRR